MCTIRGATTVKTNTKEDILEQTAIVLQQIIEKNGLQQEDIVSILFTATNDLDAVYPAVAARQIGLVDAGLMCMQEMFVVGSLPQCIRVLVSIQCHKKQNEMVHVYLNEAKKLRPDLAAAGVGHISIAIDGPAGSGKSTIAKQIAKEKGYIYVDTGAMYRTVGLHCLRQNKDTTDIDAVTAALADIDIDIVFQNNEQRIYLNQEDVTDLIRTQEVARASSNVAAIHAVRERLVEMQRNIAKANDVIMDGRDIGTHVLKHAKVKIYLDASEDERATRRCGELKERNIPFDYETVKKEIIDRDFNDMNRQFSPLKKAEDAVVIDTTGQTIEDVKKLIYARL